MPALRPCREQFLRGIKAAIKKKKEVERLVSTHTGPAKKQNSGGGGGRLAI